MPASAAAPAALAESPAPLSGPLAWEVLPVAVPAQVDQPQWVVRTVDGSLAVLEQERWIAPLGEEIRAAVTERLTQRLGVSAATAEADKRWRIRIDVQRFDSVPGRETRLGATWTLRSDAAGAVPLRCRADFVQSVPAVSYLALASAHQLAVAELADAIAVELKTLAAGRSGSCGG